MTTPLPVHSPADLQELIEIVQSALGSRSPMEVVGGGSKRDVGFPQRDTSAVSTARFDRVIDYDPAELVMTVGSGVKLATIQTLLAQQHQMLAFEPFDFAVINDDVIGASTIGGVVAAGFAGSRRLSAGNVRDHVLGFTGVSGRGESFVAGGRVVKNVTGYDLSKLMCGSWGQLAVLTEVTLKVMPRPRAAVTLRLQDLDDVQAYAAMTLAMRSQSDVAAAAYLPHGVVGARSHVLLRLEGFAPSVEARAHNLIAVLACMGPAAAEPISTDEASTLWSSIPRALLNRDRDERRVLWRICTPSTQALRVCTGLRQVDGKYCVDWAGALIWACLSSSLPTNEVRDLADAAGGHATLIHAPRDYRTQVCALHSESPGVAALAQRVKRAFDPAGILDPQRFTTGVA